MRAIILVKIENFEFQTEYSFKNFIKIRERGNPMKKWGKALLLLKKVGERRLTARKILFQLTRPAPLATPIRI